MNWDKNFTYFSLSTWYLNLNKYCKVIKGDQNITCIGFNPQWVDAHVHNLLTIQARELKFCVCYLQEKSAKTQPQQDYLGDVFVCLAQRQFDLNKLLSSKLLLLERFSGFLKI